MRPLLGGIVWNSIQRSVTVVMHRVRSGHIFVEIWTELLQSMSFWQLLELSGGSCLQPLRRRKRLRDSGCYLEHDLSALQQCTVLERGRARAVQRLLARVLHY